MVILVHIVIVHPEVPVHASHDEAFGVREGDGPAGEMGGGARRAVSPGVGEGIVDLGLPPV